MSISKSPSDSAVIRVITPQTAIQNTHLLYHGGQPVSLNMSLRELKIGIASLLQMRNLSLPRRITTPSSTPSKCNCYLAQTIANQGTWETLRCRLHGNDRPTCDYPHGKLPGGDCGICQLPLTQWCNSCKNPELLYNPACPLVIDADSNHSFHHHCYMNQTEAICPGGCQLRSFLSTYILILRDHP
jgi:Anaphase-promoting complex subunit 11 RING-H2 finger